MMPWRGSRREHWRRPVGDRMRTGPHAGKPTWIRPNCGHCSSSAEQNAYERKWRYDRAGRRY